MANVIWTADGQVITGKPKAKPKVTVLPAIGAERYPFKVPVISFNEWNGLAPNERHTYPLPSHLVDVQRIYCDDIDQEIDSTYRMFDYIDAIKIITFLDKYKGQDIMVHCAAGVSRSPACGKFMIDFCGYERDWSTNYPVAFFDHHNTHVYYTLKRAMLDHMSTIQRIKDAHNG